MPIVLKHQVNDFALVVVEVVRIRDSSDEVSNRVAAVVLEGMVNIANDRPEPPDLKGLADEGTVEPGESPPVTEVQDLHDLERCDRRSAVNALANQDICHASSIVSTASPHALTY